MASEASGTEATRRRTLELAQGYLALLSQGRLEEWIRLWHEEAVLEFPFAPLGRASAYVGKADILAYMRSTRGRISTDKVEEIRLHPSTDPTVLVVELVTRGHMVDSGVSYDQRYVSVFECRDGLIWRYREYWNPLVSIEAHGGLENWLAS